MKIFRIILLIINVLLAVGLLLTTLAPTVAPSRSILPSLMAFGYPPLMVANVAMVVLWLLLGKWHFLWSVAAIAVRWSFVGLFMQVGGTSKVPDRSEHPQMVVIMSYNLHNLKGPAIEPDNSDSYAIDFLDLVREYNPDVMCLQEYVSSSGKIRITDSLMLMGYNHFSDAHNSTSNPHGTVVFSRLPISYVKKIDQQKVLVELMLDERRFRVCSIHMGSYQFDDADREEIEQLRHATMDAISDTNDQTKRTYAKVKETILQHETEWEEKLKPVVTESSMPMLLAGDFNDIPSSWLYAQVSKHLDDTYRDEGTGFCHTYNGGFPKFRIDNIFHSKEFHTLSYKRIKSDISDHYPVVVALDLEN